MKHIAVLASGEGTTAEAFIRAGAEGNIDVNVGLVICNNAKAGVFGRVEALCEEYGLAIQSAHINGVTHPAVPNETLKPGAQTQAEETAILELLKAGKYDLIVLMGYMKRIGPKLVREFGWKPEYTSPYKAMMLNTHPGLLPETKGLYGLLVQEHVLKNNLPFGGQTLHIVAEDYDDGPTVAEHKVATKLGDTPDSLFDRVKAAEKQYLPGDIDTFIRNRIEYMTGKQAA